MNRSGGAEPRLDRRRWLAAGCAATLTAGLGREAAASEPLWVDQRRLGPFVCRSTFPLGDRLLAQTDLAALELELRRVLALRPCAEQIELLLVNDAHQHQRLIRSRHPDAPYRRALFFKANRRSVIYAYRHADLAVDLRHEGTHALLHADLPMVPLWLDEGLAEYFEPPPAARPYGPDHLPKVLDDARRGVAPSLAELEGRRDLGEMTPADYRSAWAWTHFLLHGPAEASQQLWAMLASIRRWEPPGAMSDRLAAAFRSPTQSFVDHFRGWPDVLRAASARAKQG
ncbi:hypothetical protein [Botrimarina sp.]|uniref:hypothetical protein n=1 Tax=Botrimarina sp. TaxID=2795802 RepID=UPI0032ED6840